MADHARRTQVRDQPGRSLQDLSRDPWVGSRAPVPGLGRTADDDVVLARHHVRRLQPVLAGAGSRRLTVVQPHPLDRHPDEAHDLAAYRHQRLVTCQ